MTTKLWREAIRNLLSTRDDAKLVQREQLARARCFDLSAVDEVVYATSTEMRHAATAASAANGVGTEYSIDIGERTILPAPVSWLEFNGAAALIDSTGIGLSERPAATPQAGGVMFGWIAFQSSNGRVPFADDAYSGGILGWLTLESGIATVGRMAPLGEGPEAINADEQGVQLAFMALAALSLINSPAAAREAKPAHRGAVRDVRRATGIQPELQFTTVTLARLAATESGTAQPTSSPKAYHFCRAHTRTRSSGRLEHVRAHWRGDPAFGFRLPSYRVRP